MPAQLPVQTPTSAQPGQPALKPAQLDAQKFTLHPSVAHWRAFDPQATADKDAPITQQLQSIMQTISREGIFQSQQATAYWAYHLGRMGFFAVQGITGLMSARGSSAASGRAESATGMRLEKLVRGGLGGPVLEALATYKADFENIQAGVYKLPWDMTTFGRHKQSNPLFVLRQATNFVREAADTLGRRDRGADTSVWMSSKQYPAYYLNTFHYQTDGWMSKHSADIYETSTETLFLGKQDAMQRQTLVPLAKHMQAKSSARGMKLLEVACGTGRFATFVKDNYNDMEVTCMDASPFYLAKARENMAYWRQLRAPASQKNEVDLFVQGLAEDIPAEDNSFDVVTCIYLFHELPEDVRRKVAAEMARVVKPGGLVVLTDSVQYGDRESFDATLGNFTNFNEPYYQGYISTDIGELFQAAGLQPDMKTVASSTKALSFKKPFPAPPTADDPPTGAPAVTATARPIPNGNAIYN